MRDALSTIKKYISAYGVYIMNLLKDRARIVIYRITLIFILIALAFILTISGEGYCISPSPIISLQQISGQNITIYGQNFTPNGTAVLYGLPNVYTSNVDGSGNISWSFSKSIDSSYLIYALDGNLTSRKSNAISLGNYPCGTPHAPLPPTSPAFPMGAAIIIFIAIGAILVIVERTRNR